MIELDYSRCSKPRAAVEHSARKRPVLLPVADPKDAGEHERHPTDHRPEHSQ